MKTVKVTFALALFAAGADAQVIRSSTQPLTIKNVQNWTENGNVVPVCWETPGYEREKEIVRKAVLGTWQYFANLEFTGWAACPAGAGVFGSGSAKHVRIRITPQDATNAGGGGSVRDLGMAALSSADEGTPGMNLSFIPDGTAAVGRVEYLAVHEFGHVLGFVHEQDTPGNVEGPAYCKSSGNEAEATSLTPYDRDSIMNYCNRDGNLKGNLTDTDIRGAQAVYGVRTANVASRNSCASIAVGQAASVAWGWNDGSGMTSFALYPAAASKFLERTAVSVREGGWTDDVKWFAGDFDNDGRTDIGGAWNNGGSNTLTVRQLTASGVSAAHWAINAGGWSPSAVWLPGDFDGDGRSDVAGVWNDAGQVSIAVYLSDGKKFLNPTQWSLRDGGWAESVKWFAGDFNGDGRTDIGAAWNNQGATTLTVRQAGGGKFSPAHWSADAGNWSDSSAFVAGDFDGDGRNDVARLWNDLGNNSTSVSLSAGTSFQVAAAWSVRDGGWIAGDAVKWFPGDFDGDGRADIGVAWDDNHLNTLTVRRSTGSGFAAAHWATRAGGWRNSATWCAGHFRPTGVALETRADGSLTPRLSEPAIDVSGLAAKGEAIAGQDWRAVELRNRQSEGAARRGFDIGMAAAEGHTAPGPGKQRIHDSLAAAEQAGFRTAVAYSLERNRNVDLAAKGAAIAVADPSVAGVRDADPDVFYWLGFDIASGIFGDPALGALGNTATGPGSLGIRDALGAAGQRGFNASVALHLSRKYAR